MTTLYLFCSLVMNFLPIFVSPSTLGGSALEIGVILFITQSIYKRGFSNAFLPPHPSGGTPSILRHEENSLSQLD